MVTMHVATSSTPSQPMQPAQEHSTHQTDGRVLCRRALLW